MNGASAWSPDGQRVAFSAQRDGSENIYWQPADGTGTAERLTEGSDIRMPTSFSPDGLRLLFHQPASPPYDLGIVGMSGDHRVDGKWLVSTDGGTRPTWAKGGRELYYFLPPGRILAVPVVDGPTLSAGVPQVVVDGRYNSTQAGRTYDVTPDGERFLMIKDLVPESSSPTELVVVLNWTEELTRLLPPN